MFGRLWEKSFVANVESLAAGAAVCDEAPVALAAIRLWGARKGFDCSEADVIAMSDSLADVAAIHGASPDVIAQALFLNEPSLQFDWDYQP